jgi:hypothetical protein
MRSEAVYMERYCLLVRTNHELGDNASGDRPRRARAQGFIFNTCPDPGVTPLFVT